MDTRADIRTLILAKVDRSSRRRIFRDMSRQGLDQVFEQETPAFR